jgi:hypothetical protein
MPTKVFSLEVLRACHGDCLLMHYGTKTKPGLSLIDGGPDNVYEPFLRPRLEELRSERGLSEDDELPVDLLMLSHIDEDHVFGLLELTRELIAAEDRQKPKLVQLFDLWHNTFDDLIENDADELIGAVEQTFGPASVSGNLAADALAELADSDTPAVVDTVMVIASIPQGRELRSNCEKLSVERNVEFDGKLIVAEANSNPIDMGKGLTFTLAGPMLPDVKKLQTEHRAWLKEHPEVVERATASVLAAYSDDSKPNLSSIVVLAEVDGKTILLTGDARGDKILKGLELVGLVPEGGSIRVEVLKCPHHGSSRNVELDFFQRIIADHYVFSGNGVFGNPERATLELLAEARGDDDYAIHLTYPVDEIDVARKADWESQRAIELDKRHTNPAQNVRPKWSKAKHSLAAFLADHPDVNDRVVIVEEGVPHTIDLLA